MVVVVSSCVAGSAAMKSGDAARDATTTLGDNEDMVAIGRGAKACVHGTVTKAAQRTALEIFMLVVVVVYV